jgi:hypothetical protein
MKTPTQILLVLAVALSGCSKSDDNKSTTLKGVVSKGLVAHAQVDIYQIENKTLQNAPFISTQTDETGNFHIALKDVPQVVYITVTGMKDASTLAQCDLLECGTATRSELDSNNNGVTDFGEWQSVPEEFQLTAWISNWNGNDPISVNPFTHALARTFSTPPSAKELEAAYVSLQERFSLSQRADLITVVDVTGTELDTQQLQDQLMSASLLAVYSNSSSMTEALAAITASDQSILEQSETELTQLALTLASSIDRDPYNDITNELQALNAQAAADENRLSYKDIPVLPPLL